MNLIVSQVLNCHFTTVGFQISYDKQTQEHAQHQWARNDKEKNQVLPALHHVNKAS